MVSKITYLFIKQLIRDIDVDETNADVEMGKAHLIVSDKI